jgi:plasmid stability protein
MASQAVTVNLPSSLYERLARRASRARRSVEAELVEAVMTSLPEEPDELPVDLAEAIDALHLLDDEALWRAARTALAPERAARLEELHIKRQGEGLSASEAETTSALMKEYSRTLLVRARAAELLKQRGHDVSELIEGRRED